MRQAKKYESTEEQGEGSYVVMWRRTHKQAKMMRDDSIDQTADKLEHMIAEAIVEWNWTDADGEPLPLPKDDPAVLDDMPENEVAFLMRVFFGNIDVKN